MYYQKQIKIENMYSISIKNNENNKDVKKVNFLTKKEANAFIKNNCEKRGYDYFSKENRSLEYSKLY